MTLTNDTSFLGYFDYVYYQKKNIEIELNKIKNEGKKKKKKKKKN